MAQNTRRNMLKGVAAAAAAAPLAAQAQTAAPAKKVFRNGPKPARPPLFSPAVALGNLLFVAGMNSGAEKDIKAATDITLKNIQKQLEAAGSSMDKVLKATVYLTDITEFAAMNEVYQGRFGDDPPVRTTIAVTATPGNAKIEIDVIASL